MKIWEQLARGDSWRPCLVWLGFDRELSDCSFSSMNGLESLGASDRANPDKP